MKLADLPRVLVYLFLVKPFTRLVIGFNTAGLKNIKGLGQMILVSNHSSHLDTLIILSSLGLKQAMRTHPVAARDYFGKGDWLGNAACRLFNLVTVPRHRISRSDNPLDIMGDVLRRGENILIFPEGSRGEADHMAAFKEHTVCLRS